MINEETFDLRPNRLRYKKRSSFNPNRDDLEKAMKEFRERGGRVQTLDPYMPEFKYNHYRSKGAGISSGISVDMS
jgi:hypothetical protein